MHGIPAGELRVGVGGVEMDHRLEWEDPDWWLCGTGLPPNPIGLNPHAYGSRMEKCF